MYSFVNKKNGEVAENTQDFSSSLLLAEHVVKKLTTGIEQKLLKGALLSMVFCGGLALLPEPSRALEKPQDELAQASVTTKLGTQVDLDTVFTDEAGSKVPLREAARDGRPFIIVPAYYSCPRMCGLVLKAVHNLILELKLKLNSDYRVLTVSFDPSDTPTLATERGAEQRNGLGDQQVAEQGWRFLVGTEESIKTVMNQIGFHYLRDGGEFAHSAAIMILTPEGQISQYFTGISFSPGDVKLALVEAGRGSIGSALDHFLLFCFRFDQTKGRYTWAAFNLMRAGGALSLVLLAGLILVLRRREHRAALNQ